MARLYNGFNALALGQAINNTNNDVHNRRMTGLQMLGNSLQDFAREKKEEDEKALQKQSAMDFLTGNGMSEADATALVNSGIAPGELAMYMRGRLDKKADTETENKRADFEYGRARSDSLFDKESDRIYAEGLAEKKRKESLEDAARAFVGQMLGSSFGALNASAMNEIPSQVELDKYNNVAKSLSDFAKNQYGIDIGNLILGQYGSDNQNGIKTSEWYLNDLDNLVKDGVVFPEDIEKYENDLKMSGDWDKVMRITGFETKYNKIKERIKGSKSKRNSINPGSGNTPTKEDYINEDNAQEEARKLKGYVNAYNSWVSDRTGMIKKPNIPEKYLKKMSKKMQEVYKRN